MFGRTIIRKAMKSSTLDVKIKLINVILTKLHGSEVNPKKYAGTNQMKFNFTRSRFRITPGAVVFEIIATPSRLLPSGMALVILH